MSKYITDRNIIETGFRTKMFKNNFDDFCLQVFRFQYSYNLVYREFCELIGVSDDLVSLVTDIPFLPISFFKSRSVITGKWQEEAIFRSSGTTGQVRSQHYVKSLKHYLTNTIDGFTEAFGDPSGFCFLAILPGYSERPDSSLIFMVNEFIRMSSYESSGFYLGKEDQLLKVISENKRQAIPTILFGVSFALLDLCQYEIDFSELIVIETGGMKNSEIDLTKEEIITKFKQAWSVKQVSSEYGMTELLSQSYSNDGKWCRSAATKRIVIGDLKDPFAQERNMKTGIIKVIDLANYDTCSFIETEDIGIKNQNGTFQVLGRLDTAELRGCNLLLNEA